MFFWFISKEFICGLICAGVLKSLNTSSYLGARLTYLFLTTLLGVFCLVFKLFAQSFYSKFLFLLPVCANAECISFKVIRGVMLATSLFHLIVLALSSFMAKHSASIYQKLWLGKLAGYLGTLAVTLFISDLLVLGI